MLPELGGGAREGPHPRHRRPALQRIRVIGAQVVDRDEQHVGARGRRRVPCARSPGASVRQEEQQARGEGARDSSGRAAHGAHIVAEQAPSGQGRGTPAAPSAAGTEPLWSPPMKRLRIATAALVTRGSGHDVEVLVVRRAPELRFFGGYWAFPGGVVDEADHDGEPDHDVAHARCALRELYEEVGLVTNGLGALDAGLRSRLLQRDAAAACAEFRVALDEAPDVLGVVRPVARLTTPPFAPVLYRTRFVHLEAPAGFEPDIVPGELVEGAFARPDELLETWGRGERLVAPPVVFMLEHLAELGREAFLERIPAIAAELEAGRLHPIRNVPGVVMAPLSTRTLPPATTTNAYLVGTSRLFVVDPAPTDPVEQQRLFDLIDDRTRAGADLVGVLLTHHHPDHVGAVEATSRRYDAPVLAHPETLARLESRRRERPADRGRSRAPSRRLARRSAWLDVDGPPHAGARPRPPLLPGVQVRRGARG